MSNTTKRKGRNYNSNNYNRNNDNSNKDNSNNDNRNVNSGNETDTTYNTGNLMQKYVEEETPTIAEERMAAVRMAAKVLTNTTHTGAKVLISCRPLLSN